MVVKRIFVTGLWGKCTLDWSLYESVNVLAGVNGSGKSTVLRGVAELLRGEFLDSHVGKRLKRLRVELSEGYSVELERFNDDLKALKDLSDAKPVLKKIIKDVEEKKGDKHRSDVKTMVEAQTLLFEKDGKKIEESGFLPHISSDFISTFDFAPQRPANPSKAVEFVLNTDFSELDRHLEYTLERYKSYQINLSTRMANLVTSKRDDYEGVVKLFGEKNRFLDILEDLLRPSGKRINREVGDIEFFFGDDTSPHGYSDLSAGEKQLLLIMLTVFMQEGKESILIMDEPEISLHIDWQSQLITRIKEVNPNCQIIISTHSPSVIIDGWQNSVVNISDLIKEK